MMNKQIDNSKKADAIQDDRCDSNDHFDQRELTQQVVASLDASVESLSPDVRRKLNQARIAAIDSPKSRRHFWQFASGIGFTFVFVFAIQFGTSPTEEPLTPFAEVLEEDVELLDELEFIYWMAEENETVTL